MRRTGVEESEIKELLSNCATAVSVPDVLDKVKRTDLTYFKQSDIPFQQKAKNWFTFPRLSLVTATSIMIAFIVVLVTVILPLRFDTNVYATVNLNAVSNFEIKLNSSSQVINITTNQQGQPVLQALTFRRRGFEQVATDLLKISIDKGLVVESDLDRENLFTIHVHSNNTQSQQRLRNQINGCKNVARQHIQGGGHGNGNGNKRNLEIYQQKAIGLY